MSNYLVEYTITDVEAVDEWTEEKLGGGGVSSPCPTWERFTADSPGSALNGSNPILKDYPEDAYTDLRVTNEDTGEAWVMSGNELVKAAQ